MKDTELFSRLFRISFHACSVSLLTLAPYLFSRLLRISSPGSRGERARRRRRAEGRHIICYNILHYLSKYTTLSGIISIIVRNTSTLGARPSGTGPFLRLGPSPSLNALLPDPPPPTRRSRFRTREAAGPLGPSTGALAAPQATSDPSDSEVDSDIICKAIYHAFHRIRVHIRLGRGLMTQPGGATTTRRCHGGLRRDASVTYIIYI